MLKNYLIFTLRNLLKHKTHALINILGLAIGIASFLIIYLYISDELSYDRYHKESANIYRLVNVYDFDGVGENSASSPFPVAFTLMNDYPAMIENIVRLFNFQAPRSFVEYEENKFNEKRFFFADSTFFDIFNYEFIAGNPETALDEMNLVVITESTAKRYFGVQNPIGKSIRFETSLNLQVSGVIKDVPEQSHFKFDFIGSMSSLRAAFGGNLPQTWVWNPCWTYLLLNKNVDPKALEAEFPNFIQKYFFDAERDNVSLYLQPLTSIHLKSDLDYEISPNNDMSSIYILSVIALFLLAIAIINYMNLATATSSGRAKEIGIKKVNGAYQSQLILQFIGESILLTYFALTMSVILIELLLPAFNEFTGKSILFSDLVKWQNIIVVLGLGAFIGTISGIYPAFFLASFQPLDVLISSKTKGTKSGTARKVLVVAQFTISISLIIGTIVIRDQLNFMRNADLGFDKENIVILPINRTPIASSYESFKKELLQSPDILSVSAMDDIFGMAHNTHEFRPEGFPDDKWQFYPAMVVQYDFIQTFGMQIVAGRDYNEANKTDPVNGILINEAMVKHMGWNEPQEAIGKKFRSL
jgi:putative ABC transport system permease protein